ncbi:hypothetical protein JTB14_024738 [Gonioctena quinquepunctata]|nr:hypothetical protein JTB14_024738 [Gonioctena quinquepunctata]
MFNSGYDDHSLGRVPFESEIRSINNEEQALELENTDIVQSETQPGCSMDNQNDNRTIDESWEETMSNKKMMYVDFSLTGRRIVDIGFFFQIINSGKHDLFGCDIADMEQTNSSGKDNSTGTTDSMDINSTLTLGVISTGIGYSLLEEISAAINMPVMAERTYSHYADKLSDIIFSTTEIMQEAGKEEAELATGWEKYLAMGFLS